MQSLLTIFDNKLRPGDDVTLTQENRHCKVFRTTCDLVVVDTEDNAVMLPGGVRKRKLFMLMAWIKSLNICSVGVHRPALLSEDPIFVSHRTGEVFYEFCCKRCGKQWMSEVEFGSRKVYFNAQDFTI